MAAEVALDRYLFLPRSMERIETFQYNPLHDLESVWWVAMWTCFGLTAVDDPIFEDVERLDKQRTIFHALFPQSVELSAERLSMLLVDSDVSLKSRCLSKAMNTIRILVITMHNDLELLLCTKSLRS